MCVHVFRKSLNKFVFISY